MRPGLDEGLRDSGKVRTGGLARLRWARTGRTKPKGFAFSETDLFFPLVILACFVEFTDALW